MTALWRYAWVGAVAAALVLSPSDGAHSGADWEAAYAGTDWEEIRRAAEGGDAEAQIELGYTYLEDEDALVAPDEIPQDDVRAYVWLSLGVAGLSDAGTDELLIARDLAMDDLRRLEERMTALQLGTAQQLIQDRREGAPQAEQTSTIREAQRLLRELGYAPGPADGIWGPRTERAYRSYLRDAGLPDMAFSAQVLEGMREATRSAAGHAVRAGQPGTGQAETSADRTSGATETIVYDNGSRYDGQTRGGEPHGRGIITWTSGNYYEGDFVDGKRTGRGVFTWANGDRYEGDFVEGKRTGRGVAAWANGNRYEGDFVDNRRTGRGVFTWPNGDRYEGNFVEGKETGRGVFTWANGDRYKGDFVKDKLHGQGIYTWANGDRYEGEFRDGKQHGQGTFTWHSHDRYEGDFVEGKRTGRGVMTYADGERYEGEFRDGERHGRGVLVRSDGSREEVEFRDGKLLGSVLTMADGSGYVGEAVDGKPHGRGAMDLANGLRYEGEFRGGKRHGQGVLTFPKGHRYAGGFRDDTFFGRGVFDWSDGRRYEGEFRDNMLHGHGVMVWPDGNRYEGEYRDHKQHGHGVFSWANGDRYEGDFVEGKRTGRGVYTWTSGNRYEGEFRDGKQHGPGISIKADGRRFAVEFRDGKQIDGGEAPTAPSAGKAVKKPSSGKLGVLGVNSGREDDALDCVEFSLANARDKKDYPWYENYEVLKVENRCDTGIVVEFNVNHVEVQDGGKRARLGCYKNSTSSVWFKSAHEEFPCATGVLARESHIEASAFEVENYGLTRPWVSTDGSKVIVEYRARYCPNFRELFYEGIYKIRYRRICELASNMVCGVPYLKWLRAGSAPYCPEGLPADMPSGWD